MDKPGYEGFKPDGSKFHVFNEHWKWIPEWGGEGLPPVGTVCELRARGGGWGKAEIKYHGRAICVWLWLRDDGNIEQVEHALCPDHMEFRPIRTPEQIAAEERKEAISKMLRYAAITGESYRDVCGKLYDAGYRKFEIVEGEL